MKDLEGLEKEIKELDEKINELMCERSKKRSERGDILMNIVINHFKNESGVRIGDWDCADSPIGICVYNSDEDPAWDSCLICGEPDERK